MDKAALLGTTFLRGGLLLHFAKVGTDPGRLSNSHNGRKLVFRGKVLVQILSSASYIIQISDYSTNDMN